MGSGGSGTRDSGQARATSPTPAPRARSAERRREALRRRRRRLVTFAALALLVLVGTGATLAFVGHDDARVPESVAVEGVEVGGMSPEEARAAIRARAVELMREPVTITRRDDSAFSLTVTRRQLGAAPRIAPALREALEQRGPGGRILSHLGLAPTRAVAVRFTLDPAAIDRVVAQVNEGFDDPPVGATLRVAGDDIEVVPGSAGVGVDEAQLRTQLAELPERIELEVGPQPAPIGDEAARAARERALAMAGSPMTIAFQDRGIQIPPAVLRSALRFESRPPEIAVRFDPSTIYKDIAPAFAARERKARDARFEVRGDTIRLTPSAEGRRLDMAAITRAMAAPSEDRTVRARFAVTSPKVLTGELSGLGIKELVGSFSTPYNCCEPRVENIERAARALDGMILPPGRRFSLDDALGPRTTDRGYVEAPQISGGRLEDGVGGGVSQVATTLYNAAFFAGLKIEAHTPHSFYISRYPPGREATISMGGPDLIFVNDWDASLYISAVAGSNDITIKLFSTAFDRRVETTTGDRTDFTEPEEIEVLDTSLEPGGREVEQFIGSSGFTVAYTRTVYERSRVRSEESYRWTYAPQNAYIKVGPEPSEEPAPDGAPTPDAGTPAADGDGEAGAPPPARAPAPAPTPAPSAGGAAPPPPDLP